jgi:hypothetical protein
VTNPALHKRYAGQLLLFKVGIELSRPLLETGETKHFQPGQMGFPGHRLSWRFILQAFVLTAHEWLMVKIKL